MCEVWNDRDQSLGSSLENEARGVSKKKEVSMEARKTYKEPLLDL